MADDRFVGDTPPRHGVAPIRCLRTGLQKHRAVIRSGRVPGRGIRGCAPGVDQNRIRAHFHRGFTACRHSYGDRAGDDRAVCRLGEFQRSVSGLRRQIRGDAVVCIVVIIPGAIIPADDKIDAAHDLPGVGKRPQSNRSDIIGVRAIEGSFHSNIVGRYGAGRPVALQGLLPALAIDAVHPPVQHAPLCGIGDRDSNEFIRIGRERIPGDAGPHSGGDATVRQAVAVLIHGDDVKIIQQRCPENIGRGYGGIIRCAIVCAGIVATDHRGHELQRGTGRDCPGSEAIQRVPGYAQLGFPVGSGSGNLHLRCQVIGRRAVENMIKITALFVPFAILKLCSKTAELDIARPGVQA